MKDEGVFRVQTSRSPWDVVSKRVGSYFKKCSNCGSFDVRRAYNSEWVEWEYYCITCNAKDDRCWKPTKSTLRMREKKQQLIKRETEELPTYGVEPDLPTYK